MAEAVSSHEYLRQQGATFVVFHPCAEQLVIGLGCSESPLIVPHCIAFHSQEVSLPDGTPQAGSLHLPWPHQKAYEALLQVQKLLHLPAAPRPANLEQQQLKPQQQQQPHPADAFPAAKAGLVSSREVPEGSDGFVWINTRRQPSAKQPPNSQPLSPLQQPQKEEHAHPSAASNASKVSSSSDRVACLAGGQVAALWPSEPYTALWLMTPDNHIAHMDTTPHHIVLDRFEAVWGWALQQLGLPFARCQQLSAVLVVPLDMTAAEVRLLADLVLGRLGFAALVVHLEPVAATFGNGTTSACVVSIGSNSSTVCCVDDAVVLPPVSSRFTLPLGLNDVAAALTGWMGCYGHWPQPLQQQGIGCSGTGRRNSSSSGGSCEPAGQGGSLQPQQAGRLSSAAVYNMLLLEDLVLQQCYFPKENYQPGLLGQPMLEDQQPAVVPVRLPGKPTTNYNVSLGSWAAVASMALFYPELAPSKGLRNGLQPTGQHLLQAAPAPAAGGPAAAAGIKQELAPQPSTPPAAAATAGLSQGSPAAAAAAAVTDPAGQSYKHYHACVLDLPAAEALYLQGQIKSRLEAGDTSTPPNGLYLLPLELADKPVVGPSTTGTTAAKPASTPSASLAAIPDQKGPAAVATPGSAAGAGGAAGADSSKPGGSLSADGGSIGLDEAVFRSIMATARGRPELFARLAAGLLLVGPGGGLRGLGSMLERRLGQKLATEGQVQVVSALEPRAEPAHMVWKGAALLAALDAGRENWLPRHQWVEGGMTLPAPAAAKHGAAGAAAGAGGAAGGGGAVGTGSSSVAAAGRHTKLFYYCKAEQGML